jgi:UDP-N-acetyl-D-glucosamine dehydrogenase
MKVVIAGQGYVGLPIAMEAVAAGHDVVGFEVRLDRVQRLLAGSSYIEDVPDAALQRALQSSRFVATNTITECRNFDVLVITVPTPLTNGVPDLSSVEICAADFSALLTPGCTVILESTTYPGTTEEVVLPILEKGSGLRAGHDFHLGYSPERIDPGSASWDLRTTPKVVAGIDGPSLHHVTDFYDSIVNKTIPVSNPRVAELTKLLENTFRHVNIALVNELAIFADELGVDVWEAIDAASTKPFGFMPFRPGPGVGGHCLPIDPSYLSWKVEQTSGTRFRFIELANDINQHMPDYVATRAMLWLNRDGIAISTATILVVGLAYKRNTSDARESPGPIVCDRMAALGARVLAADPFVSNKAALGITQRVELDEAAIRESDLTVIVTDHDAFDWDLIQGTSRRVLDTRHRLPAANNVEYL